MKNVLLLLIIFFHVCSFANSTNKKNDNSLNDIKVQLLDVQTKYPINNADIKIIFNNDTTKLHFAKDLYLATFRENLNFLLDKKIHVSFTNYDGDKIEQFLTRENIQILKKTNVNSNSNIILYVSFFSNQTSNYFLQNKFKTNEIDSTYLYFNTRELKSITKIKDKRFVLDSLTNIDFGIQITDGYNIHYRSNYDQKITLLKTKRNYQEIVNAFSNQLTGFEKANKEKLEINTSFANAYFFKSINHEKFIDLKLKIEYVIYFLPNNIVAIYSSKINVRDNSFSETKNIYEFENFLLTQTNLLIPHKQEKKIIQVVPKLIEESRNIQLWDEILTEKLENEKNNLKPDNELPSKIKLIHSFENIVKKFSSKKEKQIYGYKKSLLNVVYIEKGVKYKFNPHLKSFHKYPQNDISNRFAQDNLGTYYKHFFISTNKGKIEILKYTNEYANQENKMIWKLNNKLYLDQDSIQMDTVHNLTYIFEEKKAGCTIYYLKNEQFVYYFNSTEKKLLRVINLSPNFHLSRQRYFCDSNSCFYLNQSTNRMDQLLVNNEPLIHLGWDFYKSPYKVYLQRQEILGIDAGSVKCLFGNYIADKNDIYYIDNRDFYLYIKVVPLKIPKDSLQQKLANFPNFKSKFLGGIYIERKKQSEFNFPNFTFLNYFDSRYQNLEQKIHCDENGIYHNLNKLPFDNKYKIRSSDIYFNNKFLVFNDDQVYYFSDKKIYNNLPYFIIQNIKTDKEINLKKYKSASNKLYYKNNLLKYHDTLFHLGKFINVDIQTFNRLGKIYFKDKNFVYYYSEIKGLIKLKTIDISSAKVIQVGYKDFLIDNQGLYIDTICIIKNKVKSIECYNKLNNTGNIQLTKNTNGDSYVTYIISTENDKWQINLIRKSIYLDILSNTANIKIELRKLSKDEINKLLKYEKQNKISLNTIYDSNSPESIIESQ